MLAADLDCAGLYLSQHIGNALRGLTLLLWVQTFELGVYRAQDRSCRALELLWPVFGQTRNPQASPQS